MLRLYILCTLLVVVNCQFGHTSEIKKARDWLISQSKDWSWGEDTPRALIALALSGSDTSLNFELYKRELNLQIAAKQMKNAFTREDKMLCINSLLATCQNPRNFYGVDLTTDLKIHRPTSDWRNFPMLLTLCNSGHDLEWTNIERQLPRVPRRGDSYPMHTETIAFALLAIKCCLERKSLQTWDPRLQERIDMLLQEQLDDGSFGFLHTTAIVTQTLMVYQSDKEELKSIIAKAIDFLIKQQDDKGYFHDLLGTYLVLPILNGKTLRDLGKMSCKKESTQYDVPNTSTKKINVHLQYDGISITINIPVYKNSSIFDILEIAAKYDKSFSFETTTVASKTFIDSIAGKVNDLEKGIYWTISQQQPKGGDIPLSYSEDISKRFPLQEGHHTIIFHYKKL